MQIFSFLIFLFTPQLLLCQIVYTSPITQYFPGIEVEYINRTISINDSTIVIESETPINTIATQTFYIREYIRDEMPQGLCDIYECSTKDRLYTTYFIKPVSDKVEYIEVTQPRQMNIEPKGYRFLLDYK